MALPNLPLGEDQISFALQEEEKDVPSSGSAVSSLPMGGNQPQPERHEKAAQRSEKRESTRDASSSPPAGFGSVGFLSQM